jgi:hypothetical protein
MHSPHIGFGFSAASGLGTRLLVTTGQYLVPAASARLNGIISEDWKESISMIPVENDEAAAAEPAVQATARRASDMITVSILFLES